MPFKKSTMTFRKYLYELLDEEYKGEMHYLIEFPENIQGNEEACQVILDEFKEQVEELAKELGLKLEKK